MMFQCPAVGTGSFCITTSITTRLPGRDRALERRLEVGGGAHLDAVDAVGLGDRRVVGRVRLAVLLEHRAEGRAVVRLLEAGDRAEREVVHDHPDDGDVLLERGREHRRVLAEPAVADQRDDHAVGARELRAERRRRAEAHRRVAPGREDRARLEDRELLADAVLVPAHVGRDQRVARQRCAHVGEDALGPHRIGVARRVLAVARDEGLAYGGDLARELLALACRRARAGAPTRLSTDQRLLEIGDGADLDRVVAADLGGIDVDVDELGRREVERVLGLPRAAVGLREARAERRGSSRRRAHWSLMNFVPQNPVMPSTSGWSSGSAPLPISVCATGICRWSTNVAQLVGRVGEHHAAADVEQRSASRRASFSTIAFAVSSSSEGLRKRLGVEAQPRRTARRRSPSRRCPSARRPAPGPGARFRQARTPSR